MFGRDAPNTVNELVPLWGNYPKGPYTKIEYTLAPKYLNRDYIKTKINIIRAHGPLGSASYGFTVVILCV